MQIAARPAAAPPPGPDAAGAGAHPSGHGPAGHGPAGDFAAFYRAHVGRVHALCLRMAADATQAVELTQDVFVRAWERRASFRAESAPGTWLHRLAVNVVLERMRADRRRRARVEPASDWLDERDVPSAGDEADVALARIDLDALLPRLADGARVVFVLHDLEGYSHGEIATLTGLAPSTVRVQLHRARRHLARWLAA